MKDSTKVIMNDPTKAIMTDPRKLIMNDHTKGTMNVQINLATTSKQRTDTNRCSYIGHYDVIYDLEMIHRQ